MVVMGTALYARVLEKGGYNVEPTEQAVREMFSDYVDCGYFSNVALDDIEEIHTADICRAFLKMKGV